MKLQQQAPTMQTIFACCPCIYGSLQQNVVCYFPLSSKRTASWHCKLRSIGTSITDFPVVARHQAPAAGHLAWLTSDIPPGTGFAGKHATNVQSTSMFTGTREMYFVLPCALCGNHASIHAVSGFAVGTCLNICSAYSPVGHVQAMCQSKAKQDQRGPRW